MNTVLIGHRGVGKTSFLKSLPGVRTFDLDQEIERARGLSVSDIFARDGEKAFRQLERELLSRILMERDCVIAVGAGFNGTIPSDVRVIWLRRATDPDGRFFLNRPNLSASYLDLFAEREARYRELATDVLQMPEGYVGGLESFVTGSTIESEAVLTLYPRHLRREWLDRRKYRFEIRNDILNTEQVRFALEKIDPKRVIFSLRKPGVTPPGVRIDGALEISHTTGDIVSLHERNSSIEQTFARFPLDGSIHKLAIEISSFSELLKGHRWWQEAPDSRAFLPRGRWQWYRSLFGPQMPLHFIREDEGSSLDQPFLWQELLQPPMRGEFAAVLGSPVHHSRTPMEHRDFFRQVPIVAVDVREEEWEEALPVLTELGLRFAAVTSPLKIKAGHANTLVFSNGWQRTNTDIVGLRKLVESIEGTVALWGGGGTKESVREVLPQIPTYSAREGAAQDATIPDTLIWAVGANREYRMPPKGFPRKKIVDLNYTDNSPGLQLAVERGLAYESGLRMFKAQAQAQREFWRGFR